MRSRRKTKRARKRNKIIDTKWRIRFLMLCAFLVMGGIVVRLWFLQVYMGQNYRAQAQAQYMISKELVPDRGTIFMQDKGGKYPVAINKTYYEIFIVPKNISEEHFDDVIALLAEALNSKGITIDDIRTKLERRNDPYEIIAHRVESNIAQHIKDAKIVGVHTTPKVYRYYPAGEVASQIIGFVGSNGKQYRGQYGLEASMEKELSGQQGQMQQARDAGGRWIATTDRIFHPAIHGQDIVLTLDYTVQFEVEKILAQAVKDHDADSGTVIVMRPNGTILAMASQPQFDPNHYSEVEDISVFINPAIAHNYEAGSVVKTMTMAIGIDTGKITPQSTYVDTGVVREAGYTIHNSENKVHGLQTMSQVLEKSLNTGMIHIEKQIGHHIFAQYMRKFGFGEKTDISLPSESAGNIHNLEPPISTIQFYTASFGQGISMTPLQLARAYAVLANGGMLVAPRIVDRIIDADGQEVVNPPQEIHRVINANSAQIVRKMLEGVVVRGHGKRAAVSGYHVGGKTGTAQVAKSDGRGYTDDITIGSFAGIAPIEHPEFVVVVKIDNPKGVMWAESTAAPVFQKVMRFLLEYYHISPTKPIK